MSGRFGDAGVDRGRAGVDGVVPGGFDLHRPQAEAREQRKELERNPLTVLKSSGSPGAGPLRAISAELVGNYALRIVFSDGHKTGIYSWRYLRAIDPKRAMGRGQ